MENCLKTQLKAVVNNSNLEKLGVLTLIASEEDLGDSPASQQRIYLTTSAPVTISVDSPGYVAESLADLDNHERSLSFDSALTQKAIYFSNGNYNIHVSDKYKILAITYGGAGRTVPKINFDRFEYMESLVEVYQGTNNTCFGNIDGLKNSAELVTLKISSQDVTGNIESLIPCTKLTSIWLAYSQVNGGLDTFAAGQVSKGRTTGVIEVKCNGIMTVGGSAVTGTKYIIFDSAETVGYRISDTNPNT